MASRDPERNRRRLIQLFQELPELQFPEASESHLKYAYPQLSKPSFPKRRMRDRVVAERRLHPALKSTFVHLLKGTGKLEYGRTSDLEWHRYMRFSEDRMPPSPSGEYSQVAANDHPQNAVNATRTDANKWFLDELIPAVRGDEREQIYLVGEPGSGKSTFMKYLINIHHEELRNERVIFSRFEYLKFERDWWHTDATLSVMLEDYVSFIMIRDALLFYAYNRTADGAYYRLTNEAFRGEHLELLFARVRSDLELSQHDINVYKSAFTACLQPDGLALDTLRNLGSPLRAALLGAINDYGVAAGAYRTVFCLVMDGLDCVAIEDFQLAPLRHQVLTYILANRLALTNFSCGGGRRRFVRATPMFILRGNTFERFYRERAIELSQARVFQVLPIDPAVAVNNAINRATDAWAIEAKMPEAQRAEMIGKMSRSLMLVLVVINNTLKKRRGRSDVFDFFGANLRGLLEFIQKVVLTFTADAISTGLLTLKAESTPIDVLNLFSSRAGRSLISRKRYRLVELLLFSYIPWFEDAVRYDEFDRPDIKGVSDVIALGRDNSQFTGVIDNIFNYTPFHHTYHPDEHCLLEKVRILQTILVIRGELGGPKPKRLRGPVEPFPHEDRIREAMKDLTGYEPRDLRHSLNVLMRAEMLAAHVGGDQRIGFSVTALGRTVVGALSRDMSYIEHVFHGTLLPEILLCGFTDTRREEDIDGWTIASIRNLYIWLAYLRFVENNDAGGVPIENFMRIYADTRTRALATLHRIIRPSHDAARRAKQEKVVASAIDEIDEVRSKWRQRTLLRAEQPPWTAEGSI